VEPASPLTTLHRSYIFLGCDFASHFVSRVELLILLSHFRKMIVVVFVRFPLWSGLADTFLSYRRRVSQVRFFKRMTAIISITSIVVEGCGTQSSRGGP
jgi:hypothetical protein